MIETVISVSKSAVKAYVKDRIAEPNERGAYPTLAGPRVFQNRFSPLQPDELPAVTIFSPEEIVEKIDGVAERRNLKIQIEIQAAASDVENQLDVISDQIFDLFRNDEYLGGFENGLVERFHYVRGQLYYDERRHLNGLCWVMDYDTSFLVSTIPDPHVSNTDSFREMDVTYELTEGNPQAPAATEETGSVIAIPQS